MYLVTLEVETFRNIANQGLSPVEGLNWLVGENGQGKTNLLESVYALLTCKSFRASQIKECRMHEASTARLSGRLKRPGGLRDMVFVIDEKGNQRHLNGKPCDTLTYIEKSPVIAFTARSKALIEGSPNDRRAFLDRMMALGDSAHLKKIARLRRSLRQLREILNRSGDLRMYQSFKSTVVGLAERIVNDRIRFLKEVSDRANRVFKQIFSEESTIRVEYKLNNTNSLDDYEQKMMRVCASEVLNRRMLMGPHLDDLSIRLDSHRSKGFASSGQVRALVLSLKLAVREWFHELHGYYPLLILDDIDAELDKKRLSRLLSYIHDKGQSFVSTSNYAIIKVCGMGRAYQVDAGTFRLAKGH